MIFGRHGKVVGNRGVRRAAQKVRRLATVVVHAVPEITAAAHASLHALGGAELLLLLLLLLLAWTNRNRPAHVTDRHRHRHRLLSA